METNLESTNINQSWLNYLFENIKNLESMQRNAREGCNSLMDYFSIPYEMRQLIISETQYKNLRFMVTEISVILSNISPIVEKEKLIGFGKLFENVVKNIDNESLFLKKKMKNNQCYSSETTKLFNQTLDIVCMLKEKIINEIGHVLYIREKDDKPKW